MQCFEHLGRAEELDLDSLDGVDSSELGLATAGELIASPPAAPVPAASVSAPAPSPGEIGVRKDNSKTLYVFSIYNGRDSNGAYLLQAEQLPKPRPHVALAGTAHGQPLA